MTITSSLRFLHIFWGSGLLWRRTLQFIKKGCVKSFQIFALRTTLRALISAEPEKQNKLQARGKFLNIKISLLHFEEENQIKIC